MGSVTSILIVEPDGDTRRALATALTRKGFVVVCAATAKEARRRLRAREPGLVLLDYGIPVTEARRFAEARRRWSSAAVILLVEKEKTSFAARSTDAVELVRKPVDADALGSLVARYARPSAPSPRCPVPPDAGKAKVVLPVMRVRSPRAASVGRPLVSAACRARQRWAARAASQAGLRRR